MKKLFLLLVLSLCLPSTVLAAGCPAGLDIVWTVGLPMCAQVYTAGESLPQGCLAQNKNDLTNIECHPELHGSYALPGQIVSGDCVANPPTQRDINGNLNPNCGWVMVDGTWKWNGPGPKPTTPPPDLSNPSYSCQAYSAVTSGSAVYQLQPDGSVKQQSSADFLASRSANSWAEAVTRNNCNPGYGGDYTNYNENISGTDCRTVGDGSCLIYVNGSSGGAIGTALNSVDLSNYRTALNSILSQLNTISIALSSINVTAAGPTGSTTNFSGNTTNNTSAINAANQTIAMINSLITQMYLNNISRGARGTPTGTTNTTTSTSGDTSASSNAQVKVTADRLNIRNAPSVNGVVLGQYAKGETITTAGSVTGDSVEGSTKWWIVIRGSLPAYVWAGGTQ